MSPALTRGLCPPPTLVICPPHISCYTAILHSGRCRDASGGFVCWNFYRTFLYVLHLCSSSSSSSCSSYTRLFLSASCLNPPGRRIRPLRYKLQSDTLTWAARANDRRATFTTHTHTQTYTHTHTHMHVHTHTHTHTYSHTLRDVTLKKVQVQGVQSSTVCGSRKGMIYDAF